MKVVVAYPNGFVGYSVGWPIRQYSADMEEKLAAMRFSKVTAPKEKSVISNPIVENLFSQWRSMSRRGTDVDFVSDVIAAAAQAFGTTDIYEWCFMQTKSPYFTADHRQFLNDTFEFIETGRRKFSHATWNKVLRVRMVNPQDALQPYNYQEFFRISSPLQYKPSSHIYTLIERWLAQPGGFDDMLQTLHILFGEHE